MSPFNAAERTPGLPRPAISAVESLNQAQPYAQAGVTIGGFHMMKTGRVG